MARFHSKKKCPACNKFQDYNLFHFSDDGTLVACAEKCQNISVVNVCGFLVKQRIMMITRTIAFTVTIVSKGIIARCAI